MAMVSDERALAKMKDEDMIVSPFDGIEKGAVLQECRIFNDNQLNTARCEQVLVRLLYLVGQGDHLSSEEATIVFFSVTKLFQANEPSLRRLVYLAIKELAHTAEEVIIVTNCLTKDINSDVDMYRANATRVLCKITDAQMVQAIERYLKQEIVDRNPVVASAALVSGQQLIMHNKGDVVRRWVNEVTQALDHRSPMVQYHALSLLYLIKQHDRLAVAKLVQSMTRHGVRSPMATILLIRYVARIITEEPVDADGRGYDQPRPFFDFLENCLKHRSDVVVFEAARAIAALPDVTPSELQPAVLVLQRFLVQPKPSHRFAAIRTLNAIASTMPLAVTACNADMEVLIADQNRSIATLAITTLLRTGSENSIERLLKQIQNFLSDIADEFKVKVVSAIRALCIKYPSKYYALMNFLGNALREEGGYEFKKAIVDAYLGLTEKIPESKETCLSHLCEFIEDCEHTQLSTRILHLLGKEGPSMREPGKYIRYIYNRLILENATVRAAAVSALSSFACDGSSNALRKSVAVLLRQSLMDSDDEVRDRATFFTKSLGLEVYQDKNADAAMLNEDELEVAQTETKSMMSLACPVANLEAELVAYVSAGSCDVAFNIDGVSKAAMTSVGAGGMASGLGERGMAGMGLGSAAAGKKAVAVDLAAEVTKVEQFAGMGRPFKSTAPKDLTEAETEYTAKVVVHAYSEHIILEFVCVNTLNDQLLENVFVQVDLSGAVGMGEMTIVPAAQLAYGEPVRTYVCISRSGDGEFPSGELGCTLKFSVKDVDPQSGDVGEDGYEDEYGLDSLTVGIAQLMAKPAELPASFKSAWEALGPDNEVSDSFTLEEHDSVASAVGAMMELLGMAGCEGSEKVSDRARAHILLLSGVFVPGVQVMLHAKFSVTADCVALEVVLRSEDSAVSEVLINSISGSE